MTTGGAERGKGEGRGSRHWALEFPDQNPIVSRSLPPGSSHYILIVRLIHTPRRKYADIFLNLP